MISIVLLVVGSIYIDDCIIAPELPIAVVIFSAALLVKSLLRLFYDFCSFLGIGKEEGKCATLFLFFDLVLLIGFLTLSIYTFTLWKPLNGECRETLYLTTFSCSIILCCVGIISCTCWCACEMTKKRVKKKINAALNEYLVQA